MTAIPDGGFAEVEWGVKRERGGGSHIQPASCQDKARSLAALPPEPDQVITLVAREVAYGPWLVVEQPVSDSGKASVPAAATIHPAATELSPGAFMQVIPACEWEDDCPCTCGECIVTCSQPSRFTVARSDRDPSYMVHESCEAHLVDTVISLLGGETIDAIITVRWDQ